MSLPISDGLYSTYAQQMRGDLSKPMQGPVISPFSDTAMCPTPNGMEQQSVWSSWRTGGSDRVGSDYPCALEKPNCGLDGSECGRSLVLRENSIWGGITAR